MPLGVHTLLLGEGGALLSFGCNWEGQLGLGHKDEQMDPARVPWEGPRLVQTDWGFQHSLLLDEQGDVWEAGSARSGSPSFLIFQRAPELSSIVQVAAGNHHSAALDSQGRLWLWKTNQTSHWPSTPQRVEDLPPLAKVACGTSFLFAEDEQGHLWGLGSNTHGQIGLGDAEEALQPAQVQIDGLPDGRLRSLAALSRGVVLVDSQGAVWTSGNNSNGELGRTGDNRVFQRLNCPSPMRNVSCGSSHTLALDAEISRGDTIYRFLFEQ